MHQYGERGVLIDTVDQAPADVAEDARHAFGADLIDAVPAADCVLLTFASPTAADRVATLLRHRNAAADVADTARPAGPNPHLVSIDVCYDGPDLADVARHLGVTVDDVIALHSQGTFDAGFFGFSPGFAYLTGLHPRLHLPRRATPRTAVPAGAVAIAAAYTAVYPRTSPGGWHLIGHTDAVMFDPQRTPPTLVSLGAKVRFRPV
ncbi:MAG: hypothetical protein QG597_350 [Actinomycetota bacterium]|nr:hypothetical protein [Actinomycetota bacterium]